MNEHDTFRDMMGARNDLRPEEATRLDAHLAGCIQCRQLANEYARQDTFLLALQLPNPAHELRHGVFHRISEGSVVRRRAVWRWAAYLGPAAAAIVLLAAALLHAQSSRPSATPVLGGPRLLNRLPTASTHSYFGPAQTVNGASRPGPAHRPTKQFPASPLFAPTQSANADTAMRAFGSIVFIGAWTGSARSRWLRLPTGSYRVESFDNPVGCFKTTTLVDGQGRHLIWQTPRSVPHARVPGTWVGSTVQLGAGAYRLIGVASPDCRWSARVTR